MSRDPTPVPRAAPLSIRLLGPLDVRLQGEPLPPLRSRKGYWLLALLVLRAGREVRREWLAETLWPDSFGEEAFASLRQSLRDLRLQLGPEAARLQSPTSRTLRFEAAGAEIDVLSFDAAIRGGDPEALRTAFALYSGPLLEGCAELWALPEREAREQAYLHAVERLAQHALFLQRVAAVLPRFVPTAAELAAAAEICRRLDGLPLALELAAPLAELLSLPELARRLDDRFGLLAHGDPTAPERHRSLRAVIDWSFDLLSPEEQVLFRRLAVFAGPWALPAAEEIAATAPLQPLLQRLVAKSLVTVVRPAEPGPPSTAPEVRFCFLETLREYAAGRLRESGEEEGARERHLQHALHVAEAAAAALTGPDQLAWLARLDADYPNLRAALEWSLRRPSADPSPPLRLAAALGRYWQIRGLFSEGYRFLTAALTGERDVEAAELGTSTLPASHTSTPPLTRVPAPSFNLQPGGATFNPHRAHAHGWAGFLAAYLGDYPAALRHGETSVGLWRKLGHPAGIAAALGTLGIAAKDQGDRDRARSLFTESLSLYRAEGDRVGEASMLGYLGIVAAGQHEPDVARACYEESLRIRRELQDHWGIAASLNNLGLLARESGDLPASRRLLAESLDLRRSLGDRRCIAISLNHLGLISLAESDPDHARACFRESLELSRDIGDRRSLAYSLEAIARLPAAESGPAPEAAANAVRLYAAAALLRRVLPAPLPPTEAARQAARLGELRARLGDADYERAWREGDPSTGKPLTLEEAIRLALSM